MEEPWQPVTLTRNLTEECRSSVKLILRGIMEIHIGGLAERVEFECYAIRE